MNLRQYITSLLINYIQLVIRKKVEKTHIQLLVQTHTSITILSKQG